MKNTAISKYMSEIASKGHKINPRPREFYVEMQRKSVEKRLQNKKLSTAK